MMLIFLICLSFASASTQPCPSVCECSHNLKRVSCERKRLMDIPRNLPLNVTELYLGYNLLTTIPAHVFTNYTHLLTLSLKHNLIIDIKTQAFAGLHNLKYLYLTNNKLTSVSKESLQGLSGLQDLYLSQNLLNQVPDVDFCSSLIRLGLDNNRLTEVKIPPSFSKLRSFKSITFNNNPITSLKAENFKPLRGLAISKFNFGVCKLVDIENGTFRGFKRLQSLVLSYNSDLALTSVQNAMDSLKESTLMNSIDLSNSLQVSTYLPANIFSGLATIPLRKLLLRRNSLLVIKSGTFKYVPKVDLLDLSDGKLITAEKGAFSGMDSLKSLLLYNNKLQSVPTALPHSLLYLNLSGNPSIENIMENTFLNNSFLKNLTLAKCGILRMNSFAFKGLIRLEYLDLSYNRLGSNNIGVHIFQALPNLKVLDLSHNSIKNIVTEKDLFLYAANLLHLDMSHNSLFHFPKELFRGLTNLRTLNLEGNSLTKVIANDREGFIFGQLMNLTSLSLSRSGINVMPNNLFKNLSSMTNLDLQGNTIDFWDGSLFENTIEIHNIDFSRNRIKSIAATSITFLERFGERLQLDVHDNPFDCYCDMVWFRDWMDTANISLTKKDQYICAYPESVQGQNFSTFNPSSIYYKCNPPLLWYGLGGAGFVLVIAIILACVIYKNYWKVRLCIYRKTHSYVESVSNESAGEYLYLATILCNDEEQGEWVENTFSDVLPQDLSVDSQVFHYGRNDANQSIPGIMDTNIRRSNKSYRIIIVASQDYLNNNYKQTELKECLFLANERDANIKRIICILYVKNSNRCRIENMMRTKYPAYARDILYIVLEEEDDESRQLCIEKLCTELRPGISRMANPPVHNDEDDDDRAHLIGNIQV